jgi:hypothetical protein
MHSTRYILQYKLVSSYSQKNASTSLLVDQLHVLSSQHSSYVIKTSLCHSVLIFI